MTQFYKFMSITGVLFFMAFATTATAHAQDDQALHAEIKALYAEKAALLTGEKIDIERAIAEAKKNNHDDAVFVNRLKNLSNGKVTNSTMTKDDMISQMPHAYGLTRNNQAIIDVTDIRAGKEEGATAVSYQLTYRATLEQTDVYGRVVATDMSMASACVDQVKRSEAGVLQTTSSECDAALAYTVPEIEAVE